MLLVWLVTSMSCPWGYLQPLHSLTVFPVTCMHTTSTQGTGSPFDWAVPHLSHISALFLATPGPTTMGSFSPGFTDTQKCQGLLAPMWQHPSGVMASPGLHTAPHPTPAALCRTPGFHNNQEWGAGIATISLTWTQQTQNNCGFPCKLCLLVGRL